jgi:acyl-CoA thioester hydrolase
MARIKLLMPEKAIAQTTIPIRITDINYGNHLGNDAVVRIVHEARMAWLHGHGFTELDIGGIGLIMAELAVEFKSEGFYGDMIDVAIACGEKTRVGFELYYELTVVRNAENILLAVAKTGMVCYDYANKKTVSVPRVLLPLLQ